MPDSAPPYRSGEYVVLSSAVADQFGDELQGNEGAVVLETVTDPDGDTFVWVVVGTRYLCKPEWMTPVSRRVRTRRVAAYPLVWTRPLGTQKQVSCHFDAEDIMALDALAEQTRVSRSDALRVAVKRLLAGFCHCGRPVHIYEGGFTRSLCEPCSTVRCDVDGVCPADSAAARSGEEGR